MDKNIFLLLALSLAVAFWILVVSLQNLSWATPYGVCAGLENFTQPVALIIVISAVVERLDREARLNLLRVAGIAMIVMLCINSLLAILTIFYDTLPFTQYFVVAGYFSVADNTMISLSQLAATMNRFLGVFNQPAESGLAYSIGSLVWVYLATTSKRISSIAWVSLPLLIIGGSLSVSKTFTLGGFPLSMLYWVWSELSLLRIRKSVLVGGMIWGLGTAVVISLLAESWAGLDYFLRFFRRGSYYDGAISLFTGGRFGGAESGVGNLFAKTWNESPIMGFGVSNAQGLDNGYIEFFFYGGIVGLAFHIAILAVILRVAFRGLRTDPERGRLMMALWILIIGASIGAPVFTLNRSSIFLWIILVIVFGVLSKRRTSDMFNSNSQGCL
ncbi:MAG: hypothetical protein WC560_00120 [Syntrophales bacterium]